MVNNISDGAEIKENSLITQNQGNIFDFPKEKYYLCIRINQIIQIYDNFLRRKSIFSVENYLLRDFCVDICTNILHF